MRVVLDISINADNRIEGSASWPNGGEPIHFSGWLALMRLVEDANDGEPEPTDISVSPSIQDPLVTGPSP